MDRPLIPASRVAPLLAVVLAGCSLPLAVAPVGTPGAGAAPCRETRGQLVLDRVNAFRLEHGLRALVAEERLVAAALAHAADQAVGGPDAVGHLGSDGSAPGDRVTRAGYDWSRVAENVAAGPASPEAVVYAWGNSPPHRATMLSPEAVHAGIGYVTGAAAGPNHYWTLLVAAPRRGGTVDPVICHP